MTFSFSFIHCFFPFEMISFLLTQPHQMGIVEWLCYWFITSIAIVIGPSARSFLSSIGTAPLKDKITSPLYRRNVSAGLSFCLLVIRLGTLTFQLLKKSFLQTWRQLLIGRRREASLFQKKNPNESRERDQENPDAYRAATYG